MRSESWIGLTKKKSEVGAGKERDSSKIQFFLLFFLSFQIRAITATGYLQE